MSTHNFTDNGTHESAMRSRAESILVAAAGTWGSGTLIVQVYDLQAGGWFTVASYTADSRQEVKVGRNKRYRFNLSGSTTPDLYVYYHDILK